MVTVGELQVLLEAQTRDFREGLRSAERRLDRFERRTTRSVQSTGAAFRRLRAPILAVGGALASLASAAQLARFVEGSIEAAATIEQLTVRLRSLLGSQGAANAAIAEFVQLSSQTPFAVECIVQGSTTPASVLSDRDQLLEFVEIAANIAAAAYGRGARNG